MPKVSVIIATYKAEPWIERCARSLFGQTLDNIEFIFVDDCSPDKSINVMRRVLEEYPNRKTQVRVIRHKVNQGVAAARKTGMRASKGEYIIHCDPDDWVELNMYETMYNQAKATNSDIVMCNFLLHYASGATKKQTLTYYATPQECVEGYCRKGGYYYSSCGKIVRRELIEKYGIYPLEGVNLGEDANMSIKQLHYARTIAFCDGYFYHYQVGNPKSLSRNIETWANFEMGKRNTDDLVSFLMAEDPKRYRATANFLKFCTKMKILRANQHDVDLFYETYKECRKDIFKFTLEPLRARIIHAGMLYSKVFLRIYQRFNCKTN